MLYVNGELLDVTKDSPIVRHYLAKRNELLSEYDWPIVLKTRREELINPTGMIEPPRTVIIPATSTVDEEFGSVEWRYSETLARVVNGRTIYNPKSIFISGSISIEKQDVDLAFFLLYKSAYGPKSGFLYLKDEKKETDEYVRRKAALSGLSYILYDEDSPLSDDDVRTVALALGISNADDRKITTNQVKRRIEEVVTNGEISGDKYCNYRTFKEYSRVSDWVKLLARVQKLYDRKIIEYDYTDGSFYIMNNGERVNKVYKISVTDYAIKDRLFAKKLMEDNYLYSLVSEYLGEKVDKGLDVHTNESLRDLSITELRALAKAKGIKTFGVSRDDIIRALTGEVAESDSPI